MKLLLALALVLTPIAGFVAAVAGKRGREVLLPGPTSSGHHQIEERCELCHTPLTGVKDAACTQCHGAALAAQNDSHAPSKFLDPARADMLVAAGLDVRSCLPCHREHRPEARARGSVSVAPTFCFPCHTDVTRDRPSHRDFAPGSCADAGCHNYHDNRALRADLRAREKDAPVTRSEPLLPLPSAIPRHGAALGAGDADVARGRLDRPAVAAALLNWSGSTHAAAGVNCRGCHGMDATLAEPDPAWAVTPATCGACHASEVAGFHGGKHGMRAAAGLEPMSPGRARLAMKPAAHTRALGCASCHPAHSFDRQAAALEACEGCHDDAHTRAFRDSPHFTLLVRERAGLAPAGTGVSCASCHLPRRQERNGRVVVVHNQNDNLRPVDRMARDVCLPCHGLGTALDALGDAALVTRNFTRATAREKEPQ